MSIDTNVSPFILNSWNRFSSAGLHSAIGKTRALIKKDNRCDGCLKSVVAAAALESACGEPWECSLLHEFEKWFGIVSKKGPYHVENVIDQMKKGSIQVFVRTSLPSSYFDDSLCMDVKLLKNVCMKTPKERTLTASVDIAGLSYLTRFEIERCVRSVEAFSGVFLISFFQVVRFFGERMESRA